MGLFSKDIATLDDLFVHQLQDVYYAENQILKALPKMTEKATDPELKAGFERHLAETEGQIRRLDQVFEMHGATKKAVTFESDSEVFTPSGVMGLSLTSSSAPCGMSFIKPTTKMVAVSMSTARARTRLR